MVPQSACARTRRHESTNIVDAGQPLVVSHGSIVVLHTLHACPRRLRNHERSEMGTRSTRRGADNANKEMRRSCGASTLNRGELPTTREITLICKHVQASESRTSVHAQTSAHCSGRTHSEALHFILTLNEQAADHPSSGSGEDRPGDGQHAVAVRIQTRSSSSGLIR